MRRAILECLKNYTNIPDAAAFSNMWNLETPCLFIDRESYFRNLETMRIKASGIDLRPHVKSHKSIFVASQEKEGGAMGFCCQKLSEVDIFTSFYSDADVLITNQIVCPEKLNRIGEIVRDFLPLRLSIVVDNEQNVGDLNTAIISNNERGKKLDCIIEINIGQDRCGVDSNEDLLKVLEKIETSAGLNFKGIQAYHGNNQHNYDYEERRNACLVGLDKVSSTLSFLESEGVIPDTVTGGGTGDYEFVIDSGLYSEIQPGSYPFMDVDYAQVEGNLFENSLFVLATVMSVNEDRVVIDCGEKGISFDSGLPKVIRAENFEGGKMYGELKIDDVLDYQPGGDEHGIFRGENLGLKIKDKVILVPSHCDPTFNRYNKIAQVIGEDYFGDFPVFNGPGY